MVYYRYSESCEPEGISVWLTQYHVHRETKCYAWVKPSYGGKVRKVRKGALRSHCYATKQEAWTSYLARKKSQHHHATHALTVSKFMIENAPKDAPENLQFIGKPVEFNSYHWGDY